jgi:hypothetical protein
VTKVITRTYVQEVEAIRTETAVTKARQRGKWEVQDDLEESWLAEEVEERRPVGFKRG